MIHHSLLPPTAYYYLPSWLMERSGEGNCTVSFFLLFFVVLYLSALGACTADFELTLDRGLFSSCSCYSIPLLVWGDLSERGRTT